MMADRKGIPVSLLGLLGGEVDTAGEYLFVIEVEMDDLLRADDALPSPPPEQEEVDAALDMGNCADVADAIEDGIIVAASIESRSKADAEVEAANA